MKRKKQSINFKSRVPQIKASIRSTTPRDKEIGARIRKAREEIGYSQEYVGECLELSFQQVQKYECGQNRIAATRLEEISVILQKPITYFYERPE